MSSVHFRKLFTGLDRAYGTGEGRWVHEPIKLAHYVDHLAGQGPGLGIAPLMDDGMVHFAAIDLDEPNFDLALQLAGLLPGHVWIDKSRSGNAHITAFFKEPIEGWVPRGIMREACRAVGKGKVEVFPKQDRLRAGMFGNYINLPLYGKTRPVIWQTGDDGYLIEYPLDLFCSEALEKRNDPEDWRKRARWLMIPSPDEREAGQHHEHGTAPFLHMCCEHIIEHREDNPVLEGYRAVVYFCMAKQLANASAFDHDESLQLMALVNDASPDPIPESELKRILFNAERGRFTSTGCDDPLFAPYAHPDCPIARKA